MYSYTVRVANSVAQVTVAGTPDGDGSVSADQQVDLPTVGGKRVNVVVTHTDSGTTATQTYTVLVIREGTVATDQAALMALYNSTDGANWNDQKRLGDQCGPRHMGARHARTPTAVSQTDPWCKQFGWDPAGRIRQPHQPAEPDAV